MKLQAFVAFLSRDALHPEKAEKVPEN